ncbi:hypothetical protein HPB47_027965 [Ixodes persulcatus]|uniref:Uncharacterized protein n=1 Tax=Ixodes persulcatus TaxID=34615 RepID=A0AC60PWV8_IXOPE|nr:hypothetical protein HPB47_027965 [Ixodes persulcatus]
MGDTVRRRKSVVHASAPLEASVRLANEAFREDAYNNRRSPDDAVRVTAQSGKQWGFFIEEVSGRRSPEAGHATRHLLPRCRAFAALYGRWLFCTHDAGTHPSTPPRAASTGIATHSYRRPEKRRRDGTPLPGCAGQICAYLVVTTILGAILRTEATAAFPPRIALGRRNRCKIAAARRTQDQSRQHEYL